MASLAHPKLNAFSRSGEPKILSYFHWLDPATPCPRFLITLYIALVSQRAKNMPSFIVKTKCHLIIAICVTTTPFVPKSEEGKCVLNRDSRVVHRSVCHGREDQSSLAPASSCPFPPPLHLQTGVDSGSFSSRACVTW